MNLLYQLGDLLFSRTCQSCGASLSVDNAGRGSLCPDCAALVAPVAFPYCTVCGDPVPGAVTSAYVCTACRTSPPAFDWARSAVRYRGPAGDCLRSLKYDRGFWNLDTIETWLAALWPLLPPSAATADAILPVPLYPRRWRQRTFNQSALIAARLSRVSGIPLRRLRLLRSRPTLSQTRLNARQRILNVRHAFFVPFPRLVRGRRFLLVDDVMTTGATLDSCTRALKSAGAAAVYVVTAARA